MKFFILSLFLVISLPESFPQGLKNHSIFKSFNYSTFGIRSALRTTPYAVTPHITGSGTSLDPYLLYDAQDVDSIRYLGLNNKYYELANDIDLSSITEFVPIPNDNNPGIFSLKGNGRTLYGLNQTEGVYSGSQQAYSMGMFSGKTAGTFRINNLVIDNFRVNKTTVTSISTIYFAGSLLVAFLQNTEIQLTNIIVKNSSLRFVNNPTTFPSQSYMGLIVGRASSTGVAGKVSYIRNCLVESDTIYYSSTFVPNSGHWIGGIAGVSPNGSALITFEYNASRYNYFYSRTGSVNRKNVGGGLLGEISSPASLFRYNYSHSNKADFGSGGAPNNHPWGFGGIFGYTTVNNIHTFVQNYAANNECLGANQSGGFYSEDNSSTTAQVIDSTLNFCDITSFTEPNTVYGSVRYSASQYPSAKTIAQLKDINTFIGWDFINTWLIDSTKNNGYPYLK
ncbi:MAG TPA: hypothetical protein PLS49_03975 [Candidatus Woesebacteria bacterium]|nr:hypothetical protein [Candidatus Woesebacteria bacterium]